MKNEMKNYEKIVLVVRKIYNKIILRIARIKIMPVKDIIDIYGLN